MTIKSRLAKLEKGSRVQASKMTWKWFVECDEDDLPPEMREKWEKMMEEHERGMSTLAGALKEITGQETTPAEVSSIIQNLKKG
jgi:hypothetical protein